VSDPYRWLEDDNSEETKAWVAAQNELTFAYLEQIPERKVIEKRLTELWNCERYGLPAKQGAWYVYEHNSVSRTRRSSTARAASTRHPSRCSIPTRSRRTGHGRDRAPGVFHTRD
jgi:prolyl oligopeptidase PreP (S9A serine peptidase family)